MLTVVSAAELHALPLLAALPEEALALLDDAMWCRFAPGEVLIPVGETKTNIFVLLKGTVAINLKGIRIASRRKGEVVGEQSFIDHLPHSAEVRADEHVTALRLPPQTVEQLKQFPEFVDSMLRTLSGKLREATSDRWERYAEHERLFGEFAAHVGPLVRDALLRTGSKYGEPRHAGVVVLYSDLRGFTKMTAQIADPNDVAATLTAYFDDMVEIIHRHGGWVDKYVGDAIMAVWNFPGLPEVSADSALRAAMQMVRASPRHTLGCVPLRTGIGINRGVVFMGNVGSERKRQFTVIGDAVNRASRFEQKSKTLGDIVCGPDYVTTLDEATKALLTPSDPQEIAGIEEKIVLYTYTEKN
jgi:class 3 adenylate cyclase